MSKFKKSERLNNKKIIENLFVSGEKRSSYPLKIIWKSTDIEGPFSLKVMISVPKRNIKLAVKRNLVKRRINEAFRLNKFLLYNNLIKKNNCILLAIIYDSKEIYTYTTVEQKINLLLNRLIKNL